MTDRDKPSSTAEAKLEQEIREQRKFSPAEAIARLAGPGAMKGASPVSRVRQAETEIGCWLRAHLGDPSGALPELLHRQLRGSQLLLKNLDRPLKAVAGYCRNLLASDLLLKELVREADVEWGRKMDERPYFERDGLPPHPDDPYTAASVRRILSEALKQLDDAAA
jgi:hypothetical protein